MQSVAEKKKAFAFTLRPLAESDIPAFIDYVNECAAREKAVEATTLEEFLQWYRSPTNEEHETLAFLTNGDGTEGRIIGEVGTTLRPGDTRSWAWMHVHPDYRNKGVGSALYAEYMRQADQAGATQRSVNPSREATLLIEFLEKRGHKLERWFWDMQLPAEQEVEPARMPDGFVTHTFVHNQDEELLTHVRNATFAEHYGFVERTVEEVTYRTKQSDFFADGIFFAFDGDKVAGFCYTSRDQHEWERRGETVGHIQLLGVMPEYRGRGLGRALLLEGVNYLRQFVSLVELGVEGKNDKALALYESVGFKVYKGWANMLKTNYELLTTGS
jgi:mycothiol synthase